MAAKKNSHTIAITNQKGGCAKTTTAINLGATLAERGKEVLIIDMDPQGHVGMGLGIDVYEVEKSTYDLLLDKDTQLEDVMVNNYPPQVKIVPANIKLAGGVVELSSRIGSEMRLRKKLKQHIDSGNPGFDICLIDCPPSLGNLTVIAINASDHLIIPCQMSHYNLEGIADLLDTIDMIKENLDRNDLEILGVLPTLYDKRNKTVNRRVMKVLSDYFGEKVFQTKISKNIDIDKAQAEQKTIFDYNPSSSGAKSYEALGKEVLKRLEEV